MGKHLITEINRMKGIMGLSLLSEGIDDLFSALFKVSDDSAKSIAKSADEIGSEFSNSLKQIVGGEGTYDDLISYVTTKGGRINTIDDIANFIKSQPDLLKTIATSSDVIMKNAAQTIIQKSDVKTLLTQSTIDVVDDLLLLNIRQNNADTIIPMIDSTITTLRKYGYNSDVSDLIKKLEDRKSIAENMKSISSSKFSDDVDDFSYDDIYDFESSVNKIFDEKSEDDILNQTETFDEYIGKLIPKLKKSIDKNKLISEIKSRASKLSTKSIEESERIFKGYSDSEKDIFIAKSIKSLKRAQDEIRDALGEDSGYFKWFKRGNDGLNKLSKEDVSYIGKFSRFVYKNYRTSVILCAVYEAYNLTQTYDKQSLSDTGKQAALGAGYCVLAGIAWPAMLPVAAFSAIKDMVNIQQYSNDAEGWKEWIEDNTKKLGITDSGFDTTENKKYINLSNDDQKFVNYDTESETFITED